MDNDKSKISRISYHQFGSMQVEQFAEMDIFGFVLMVKKVCEECNLDFYNYHHLETAIKILKMKVSYN